MAYYPYQPVDLFEDLDGASYVADSYLRLEEPRGRYTVEFSDPEEQTLMVGDSAYRQFVYEHYLDVPEELSDSLLDWWQEELRPFQVQSNSPIEIAIARALASVLEQTTQYDLQAPATPEGEDFVAYFLTTSHRGYCVHYASAAVILLRMNGIPARYVSGYTAEIVNGEALVPDSAAHAWVEVYLDDYGWYPVEVTPAAAFSGDAEEEGAVETPTPAAELTPSAEPSVPPEPSETPAAESSSEPPQAPAVTPGIGSPGRGAGAAIGFGWLCYVAAALLILGLPVLYRALRYRRWNRLTTLPDHNQAVLEVYGWYHKLTSWGGKPDQQIENLARKAKFSQHVLTAEEHREAVAILRREIVRLSVKQPFWKRPFFWYWFIWK